MYNITIEAHEEGGIVSIATTRSAGKYALSPESLYAVIDLLGNIFDTTEPFIGDAFKIKRSKRK